ncbi:MAG: hypothetical protein AAF985_23720 [Bacteroidota bacterium]
MKLIKFFLSFVLAFLFSFPLAAQSDAVMNAVARSVAQEMSKKGYSQSDHVILPVREFNMGYNTRFFPGNHYLICLSDDLSRKASIQMAAQAEYDQAEINALFQQFKVGASPEDLKMTQGASLIVQELSLKDVLIPIDYDFEFKMEEKDIQSDSKVNLMVFYKSVKNTSNDSQQNKEEQEAHQQFQALQERVAAQEAAKKAEKLPETPEEQILYDAAKKGFSLSARHRHQTKDFPQTIDITIHGGNRYLLVLYNDAAGMVQLVGTPDEEYNKMVQLMEGAEVLSAFATAASVDLVSQEVDFRESLYNSTCAVEAKIKSNKVNSETSLFVFYKSFENLGGPANNKPEDFYSKKVAEAVIAGAEAQVKAFEEAMGYEFVGLEELIEATKALSAASPSGLKYMNGKVAVDKWMEALVREAHGDSDIYKTFDAMHEDWQKQYMSYKATSTAQPLIDELDGGFKHQGFTNDDLLVVDHVLNDKVVTRYFFKIKKCADYGRIVPKHEIKAGKLHITPWQKALVPND